MAGQLKPEATAAAGGFTLIELLVVIAILAVLAVGAAMLAPGRPAAPDSDVAAFRASHDRLRAQAIHSAMPRGLFLTPRGRRAAVRRAGAWQAAGPEATWRGRVVFDRTLPGAAPPGAPQVVFLPDGSTSAFSVAFGPGAGAATCASDGRTGLTCAAR